MNPDIEILKTIKKNLRARYGNAIRDVILFGSRASGKAGEYADYDLLIVLSLSVDWRKKREIMDNVFDIALDYNILTDIHFITEEEIQHGIKGQEPIFKNALTQGIYA
ncbi:MAG: nucleotidyltransferase domain-containing protein [Bacteroidetes bacterium]|nr:nucleotidyltransferase domain-containing protein [Bacteroidota bacterium]